MSEYLVRAIETAPGVDVHTRTTVSGGGGDGRLEHLVLHDERTGSDTTVPADAVFILIGARPRTEWLPAEMERDERGFVLTGGEVTGAWPLDRPPFPQETSIPRMFAAGDVRHGSVKRVAGAVGEGASVVQAVHRVLEEDLERPARPVAAAS